ncbi:MAG: peptidase domain-containing ABC transporter [Saprospiraceae bacterium]|nr:peptidase domain-containing ABC transporter [Saprospiraceae bacterium]
MLQPKFVRQNDTSDCGVACLMSVIRMHGGNTTFDDLRAESGTTLHGTTLLGMKNAAQKHGMDADVYEIDQLQEFREGATFPCILHIVNELDTEHYVVCYNYSTPENNEPIIYSIIDPAIGLIEWTEEELLKHWKSRMAIIVSPNESFIKNELTVKRQQQWFKSIIEQDIPILLISLGLGIMISILGLATAIFNQRLIDEFIPNQNLTKIYLGLGLLFVVLCARSGLNYFRTSILLRFMKDFNVRVLFSFYRKLFDLPMLFFDTRETGDIISRLNDTRRIQQFISYLTVQVGVDILIVLISCGFISYYSWEIALLVFLATPVYAAIFIFYRKPISDNQRSVMSSFAAAESAFIDTVRMIEPIKQAGKEDVFAIAGENKYKYYQQNSFLLGTLGKNYSLYKELTATVFTISAIALMTSLVLNERLQLGEFVAILTVITTVFGAIARIIQMNFQMQDAFVAFHRMYEFAQVQLEKTEEQQETLPLPSIQKIQIQNLSYQFPGRQNLLHNVNMEAKRGDIAIITGQVGEGKSVLLQLIQKFRMYERGTIRINGTHELNEIELSAWRSKVGVVSQVSNLISGTILDNVVLDVINEAEIAKFNAFVEKYNFSVFLNSFTHGPFTHIGKDGSNLSGGQRQVISLMRALYKDPDVLLLDEPTSAMDTLLEDYICDLLSKLKQSKIIIMVAHHGPILKTANQIIKLDKGVTSVERA